MTFTLADVIDAIEKVDSYVDTLVRSGKREAVGNERYLHHMFSSYLASSNIDSVWESLAICPEHPTKWKFSRAKIRMNDTVYTRQNAIGTGRDGNFDFLIANSPPIAVEWKGPKNCSHKDLAEVFIKLLSRNGEEPKVFAAILLTKSGKRAHAPKLKSKLKRSLKFACDVLEIDDVANQNLYAFIRSLRSRSSRNILGQGSKHPYRVRLIRHAR